MMDTVKLTLRVLFFIIVYFSITTLASNIVAILNQEYYSLYNLTYNTASVNNNWLKSPSFSSEDLSYKCTNNRNSNSDAIIFGQGETLTKNINSLSYTSNINHYSLYVSVWFWIIDATNVSFSFKIHTDSPVSATFNQNTDENGNLFVNSSSDYCYKPIPSAVCNDYCGGSNYDSLAEVHLSFDHTDPQIKLEFSAELDPLTYVGIYSLTINAYLCDSSCASCKQDSTTCSACNDLAFFISTSFTCVASCADQEYTFIDLSNPLWTQYCLPCTVTNCSVCPSDICSKCLDHYYYDPGTSTCQPCLPSLNCKTCANSTSCQTCNDSYYFNPSLLTCSLCSTTLHCATCSNSTSCLSCINGYFFNSGICGTCPIGCQTCNNLGVCSKCVSTGYFLHSTGVCKQCIPFCDVCYNITTCKACSAGYQITVDSSPLCIASCPPVRYFQKSYADICISFDYSNCMSPDENTGCTNSTCCTQSTCPTTAIDYATKHNYCTDDCGTGYYMDTFKTNYKKCYHCPGSCLTCSSQNVCTSCTGTLNLVTSADGLSVNCQQCINNCSSCSNGSTCDVCSTGYVLNDSQCVSTCPSPRYSTGTTCLDCNIDSCVQCGSSSYCQTCSAGLVPVLNKCFVQCGYGLYREGMNSYCSSCPNHCRDCTSRITCLTCYDGSYLSSGICNLCHSSCLTCSSQGSLGCLSCSSPLFIFQSQCINTCPPGYFSDGFESCALCSTGSVSGCAICSSTTYCSGCTDPNEHIVEHSSCSTSCPAGKTPYTNQFNYLACDYILCQSGFEVGTNDQCQDICGDGQIHTSNCDDGNLISGDGCSNFCTVEPGFICVNSLTAPSICRYQISFQLLKSTDSSNGFIIQFSQPLTIHNLSILEISIKQSNNNSNIKFSSSISAVSGSDSQLKVDITFLVQIDKQQYVTVAITHDIFSTDFTVKQATSLKYIISEQQSSILLTDASYEVSANEKKLSESVQIVATVLQTTIISTFIPLTISGSINYVASIIDISQLIQLHQYIDIQYPYILDMYFSVFNGFTFPFVTNFFTYAIPDDLVLSSYKSFSSNKVSALYLSNMGQQYTILLIALIIHGLLKILGRKYQTINHKVDSIFKYSVYHEVIMSTYLEIALYSFLQWTNMEANLAIEYINHIIMSVTFLVVFPIPFVAAFLMKKYENTLDNQAVEERFGSIWEGLNSKYICRIYYLFVNIRKLFFSLFLVFLNSAPQAQCIILLLPSAVLIIIVLKTKPFKKKSENIKQIIQESCLILGQVFILILQANTDSLESKRAQLSFGVIIFFSIILVMHFVCSLKETYEMCYHQVTKFIKNLLRKLKKSKVYDSSSLRKKSSLADSFKTVSKTDDALKSKSQINFENPSEPVKSSTVLIQKRISPKIPIISLLHQQSCNPSSLNLINNNNNNNNNNSKRTSDLTISTFDNLTKRQKNVSSIMHSRLINILGLQSISNQQSFFEGQDSIGESSKPSNQIDKINSKLIENNDNIPEIQLVDPSKSPETISLTLSNNQQCLNSQIKVENIQPQSIIQINQNEMTSSAESINFCQNVLSQTVMVSGMQNQPTPAYRFNRKKKVRRAVQTVISSPSTNNSSLHSPTEDSSRQQTENKQTLGFSLFKNANVEENE